MRFTLVLLSAPLKAWVNFSTPKARNVVREILANSNRFGLTSQEIFNVALSEKADVTGTGTAMPPPTTPLPHNRIPVPAPPNPDHPIRSMRYLKKIVLEDMQARGEILKLYVKRGAGQPDELGQPMDLVKPRSGPATIATPTFLTRREAWVWRLTAGRNALPAKLPTLQEKQVVLGPMIAEDVEYEENDDDDTVLDIFAETKGWSEKTLQFKNVRRVDPDKYLNMD